MLRDELIRTCSHASVARAAIASIGCPLKERVDLLAGVHGLDRGTYVAGLVRQFAADADMADWARLDRAMYQQDMPLLAGLRFILETMLDSESLLDAPVSGPAKRAGVRAHTPGALRRSQGRDPAAVSRPNAA